MDDHSDDKPYCPVCDEPRHRIGSFLYCRNPECPKYAAPESQADGEGAESAEEMEKCDGTCEDDQCDDCHPQCLPCAGKGFIGWGHECTDCKGMGSLGWSESEIENEMERRGMAAEQRAMEGPTYAEARAHELDQYRGLR